jgi:hypothetical protein
MGIAAEMRKLFRPSSEPRMRISSALLQIFGKSLPLEPAIKDPGYAELQGEPHQFNDQSPSAIRNPQSAGANCVRAKIFGSK